MTYEMARKSNGNPVRGKWTKLSTTGEFGASVRGGYGESIIGKVIEIESKAGGLDHVKLVAIAKDWGEGDVCEYVISRTL